MLITDLASALEYTILRPDCTQTEVEQIVATAREAGIFGVCVPPYWVKAAKRLAGSSLSVVTVIGFPLGYQKTRIKVSEAEEAMNDGADELDMVMNNAAFRSGMEAWVKADVAAMAELCHAREKILKVILETSLLSPEEISRAAKLVVQAGADFVKTSTGFGSAGASVEHIRIIHAAVGKTAGIKASGGIKTKEFALELLKAGASRIGTSSPPSLFL
jgi:deoxyribose-phosphate aldolase